MSNVKHKHSRETTKESREIRKIWCHNNEIGTTLQHKKCGSAGNDDHGTNTIRAQKSKLNLDGHRALYSRNRPIVQVTAGTGNTMPKKRRSLPGDRRGPSRLANVAARKSEQNAAKNADSFLTRRESLSRAQKAAESNTTKGSRRESEAIARSSDLVMNESITVLYTLITSRDWDITVRRAANSRPVTIQLTQGNCRWDRARAEKMPAALKNSETISLRSTKK